MLLLCYAFSWRIHFLNGSEVSLEAGATFEKPHLSRTQATLLDSIFPQSFTLFWLHWVFRLPFFEGWVQFVKREMLSHMWVHFSKTTTRIARASATTQKKRELRDAHKLESFDEKSHFRKHFWLLTTPATRNFFKYDKLPSKIIPSEYCGLHTTLHFLSDVPGVFS